MTVQPANQGVSAASQMHNYSEIGVPTFLFITYKFEIFPIIFTKIEKPPKNTLKQLLIKKKKTPRGIHLPILPPPPPVNTQPVRSIDIES